MNAVDFHREQELPDSCIAACITMVRAWQGPPPTPNEAEVRVGMNPHTDVAGLAGAGRSAFWEPDDPRSYERVVFELNRGCWLVTVVFSGPLTHFALRRRPELTSRHGGMFRFPPTPSTPGVPHAVVLVAADAGSVEYLDPYYPRDGQPLQLSIDEFAECWTGRLAIADPSPARG